MTQNGKKLWKTTDFYSLYIAKCLCFLYNIVMKCDENQQNEYLTLADVSELLKIHPNTLRNWDANRTLKAIRIGIKKVRRYRKSDIDKFIAELNKEERK